MAFQTLARERLPEGGIAIERFEYARVGERLVVLRLLTRLAADLGAPAHAYLEVTPAVGPMAGGPTARAAAQGCRLERRLARDRGDEALLWRAAFALPLELVQCPSTFALVADEWGVLALALPIARWAP
ncbi:MAG: hypothetical protein ACRDL5_12960, partial [Solirubrobacteraceae bacterium]